jgi:hypothetical protein
MSTGTHVLSSKHLHELRLNSMGGGSTFNVSSEIKFGSSFVSNFIFFYNTVQCNLLRLNVRSTGAST